MVPTAGRLLRRPAVHVPRIPLERMTVMTTKYPNLTSPIQIGRVTFRHHMFSLLWGSGGSGQTGRIRDDHGARRTRLAAAKSCWGAILWCAPWANAPTASRPMLCEARRPLCGRWATVSGLQILQRQFMKATMRPWTYNANSEKYKDRLLGEEKAGLQEKYHTTFNARSATLPGGR